MKNTVREIIAKVFVEGYLDDHEQLFGKKAIHHPDAVVIHVRGLNYEEVEVCPHYNGASYCINPFYVNDEDGMVHISTSSSGGVVRNGDVDRYNKEMDLNELENESHYYAFHIISNLRLINKAAWEKKYGKIDREYLAHLSQQNQKVTAS